MTVCNDGHEEIVFDGVSCPLCETTGKIAELNDMLDVLNDDIDKLEDEIEAWEGE